MPMEICRSIFTLDTRKQTFSNQFVLADAISQLFIEKDLAKIYSGNK